MTSTVDYVEVDGVNLTYNWFISLFEGLAKEYVVNGTVPTEPSALSYWSRVFPEGKTDWLNIQIALNRLDTENKKINYLVNYATSIVRSGNVEPSEKLPCYSHDWKKYVGFTEQYEYCTKCDEKRETQELF
jgi:hypothetical protein